MPDLPQAYRFRQIVAVDHPYRNPDENEESVLFAIFSKRRSAPVPVEQPSTVAAYAKGDDKDYGELITRIVNVYKDVYTDALPQEVGMWDMFFEKNRDLHEAILDEATARGVLDNPGSTNLFYGFDNLMKDVAEVLQETSKEQQDAGAAGLRALLYTLSQAVGATRLWRPESGGTPEDLEPDDLIEAISQTVGAPIDFPNPFPNEFGLMTKRGLVSHRAVDAIYQAYRIKQLADRYGNRVLEIGAGLGRTAYYAHVLGVQDYTIIDLPFTNVSQANFLGRVLPRNEVCLYGEPEVKNAIKIMPASRFMDIEFDVVANIDSMTEMVPSIAEKYCDQIMAKAKIFWSVNHEANPKAVRDMPRLKGRSAGRFPYWMRPGYAEELYLGDSEAA